MLHVLDIEIRLSHPASVKKTYTNDESVNNITLIRNVIA